MVEKKKLTKKQVNLRGLSKKVFDSLCINPTTNYAIKKTGKSKESVGRVLKKLTDKGYIKRLGRGHYKVNQNTRVLNQVNQNKEEFSEREQQNLRTEDYFRLHNLQIAIKVFSDDFKKVKNLAFKRKVFKNIRPSGANGGHYFNIDGSYNDYMLTSKNLFLFFARDWDIKADNIKELHNNLYNAIMEELDILRVRYKVDCFKDGRVNFDIRNMHVALVRNGIAKEMRDRKMDKLVIYDDVDGKPRFIFDFSNLLNELEAIHPEKGIDDADEAQRFMDKLKDGKVNEVLTAGEKFFNDDELKLSDLKKVIYDLSNQVINLTKENQETAAGLNSVVQIIKSQLPKKRELDPLDHEKPYYVG